MPDRLTAMLLCLGNGARMRPLSLRTPKSLLEFCLRPLLEYALEALARHQVSDVVIVAESGSEQFDRFEAWGAARGMRVTIVKRSLAFGSAGVVRSVAAQIASDGAGVSDDLLIVHGDSLFSIDLTRMVAAHRAARARGCWLTVAHHEPDDLIEAAERTNYGMLLLGDDSRVLRFVEKPLVTEIPSRDASAGLYMLDARALEHFPLFAPADLSRDVITTLAQGTSSPVFGFDLTPGYRYDIGSPRDYLQRQLDVLTGRLTLEGVSTLPMANEGEGRTLIGADAEVGEGVVFRGANVIGSAASIGRGAELEDSVLLSGARIGPTVRLRRTIVGPHARIGERVALSESVVGGWSVVERG